MMTPQVSPTAKQRKQTLNIIWFTMTASVAICWYAYLIAGGRAPNASTAWMIMILAIVSFMECIGAWIFYRVTISKISQQVGQVEVTQLLSETISALERRLMTMTLICLATFQAIVVYGLVGSFWGSPYPNTFERFAIFGLFNLLVYRVRAYPTIFSLLERLEKIRLEIK